MCFKKFLGPGRGSGRGKSCWLSKGPFFYHKASMTVSLQLQGKEVSSEKKINRNEAPTPHCEATRPLVQGLAVERVSEWLLCLHRRSHAQLWRGATRGFSAGPSIHRCLQTALRLRERTVHGYEISSSYTLPFCFRLEKHLAQFWALQDFATASITHLSFSKKNIYIIKSVLLFYTV